MKTTRLFMIAGIITMLVLVSGGIALIPMGPAPIVAAQATPATADIEVTLDEQGGGGGAKNVVKVNNRTDDRRRLRGRIQLNQIPGPTVEPVNYAEAHASCTDCETIAVALQVNLIDRDARKVTPQNAAVAINVECIRCRTIAVALQYVYSVDDPREVPKEVDELIRTMDRELREIGKDRDASLSDVITRVNDVIGRFQTLAESLNDERAETNEETSPNATPGAAPTGDAPEADDDGDSAEPSEITATPDVQEATATPEELPATSTVAPSPTPLPSTPTPLPATATQPPPATVPAATTQPTPTLAA